MRRFTLSTKLFAAAAPLLLVVAALLALTARNDINQIASAQRSAELGSVWQSLGSALAAIDHEIADGYTTRLADPAAIDAGRSTTDQALAAVAADVERLELGTSAVTHATNAQINVELGRTAADGIAMMGGTSTRVDPIQPYESASRQLISIGQLLPASSDNPGLGRDLLTLVRIAEARLAASSVNHSAAQWALDPTDQTPLSEARASYTLLESLLAEFEATAQEDWATEYRASGFALQITDYRTQLDSVIRSAQRGEVRTFDTVGFKALIDQSAQFETTIRDSIVEQAAADADATRTSTLIRIAVTLAAIAFAAFVAWWLTRSVTRRVKAVAESANQVAGEQLPALVEALRDPRGKAVLPTIAPLNDKGTDELADLAKAFNAMQGTLVNVAHEQVEVLRRGVSEIFVTMARRNRSLIDRQLAMLDEFEAEVDDPAVLSNYYQLDHMATRMRRNSESLLVLASAEPKRRRVRATEIDDVVRAAIGEVEDYRRIEIEALESLQVRGNVVADVSHLLAELLDNATSFSPPDSLVRVGGRRAGDSYMVRIVDNGVGIGSERLRELNELLREPPIVGLSVEPTLGISVVSLLAHRHGIEVTVSQGNPGTTVDVLLPSALFGPIDELFGAAAPNAAPLTPPAQSVPAPVADPASLDATFESFERQFDLTADQPQVETVAPAPVAAEPFWTTPADDRAATDSPATDTAPATPAFDLGSPWPTTAEPFELPARNAAPTALAAPADLPVRADARPLAPPATPGEFDRVPAPPLTADGLARRPVTPTDARPAPAFDLNTAFDLSSSLPTRTPGGRGPDGPDRLSGMTGLGSSSTTEVSVAPSSSPSALQAALSAFDTRRNGSLGDAAIGAPTAAPMSLADALPTRPRVAAPTVAPRLDEPVAIQSRLDPDALRERLRAFQSEFRTASVGETDSAGTNTVNNQSHSSSDLGGDRR